MIVNNTSRIVIITLEINTILLQIVVSLTDNSRGVIHNHNMFIVQATGYILMAVPPKR
jgi:hypothetical protein